MQLFPRIAWQAVVRRTLKRSAIELVSVLALLFVGISAPSSASGQEAPSNEASNEARRMEAKSNFEAGVTAYDRGRYREAVHWFLAADRLAPSATLSFNAARAYERLGDDSSALRWFRDYLRRNPNADNAHAVQATVSILAAALAKRGVQQVTLMSEPPGATVEVDGQPRGVTPLTLDLAPGTHQLLLSLRGFQDAVRSFTLDPSVPGDFSFQLDKAAPVAAAPIPSEPSPRAAAPQPARTVGQRSGTGASASIFPWVTIGAGAALLGGAATFEILRRSAESDAENQPVQREFAAALDRMESRKTTARILLGAGGAVALTGVVLLVIDSKREESMTAFALSCGSSECAVTARSRF